MALTIATKTLVDALPTTVTASAKTDFTDHGLYHGSEAAALKEIYGIRRYKALITQTGTNTPTAVVLENTFTTTPAWARSVTGLYTLTFGAGEAAVAKRMVVFPSHIVNSNVAYYMSYSQSANEDVLAFWTCVDTTHTLSDGALLNFPIVVEVYP